MAALLRQGATMLELICPQCENILFRLKDGKMICPSCEKEVIFQKKITPSLEEHSPIFEGVTEISNSNNGTFQQEINIIKKKITEICITLEKTDNLSILGTQIDLLMKIINLYKSFLCFK